MRRIVRFLVALAMFISPILSMPRAFAATVTWDGGGGDNNWTTAANWVGDVAPAPGDSLVFSGSTRLTPVNDFTAGTVFDSITFSSPNFSVSGNAIELTPSGSQAITFNALGTTYAINTTITAATSKSIYSNSTVNNISGNITLNLTAGGDMNFVTDNDTTLTVSGVIDGATDLFIVAPSSFVVFDNSNTFTSAGINTNANSLVTCSSTNCFGTSTGDITMSGGTLIIDTTVTLTNDIISSSGGNAASINLQADSTISGDLLATENMFVTVDSGVEATLSGDITIGSGSQLTLAGSGDLDDDFIHQNGGVVSGAGILSMVGANVVLHGNNTHTSETYVDDAVLDIRHANALGTTAGYTSIHDGATLFIPTTMTLAEDIRIAGVGASGFGFSGALEMSAGSNTEISGDITLLSDATIANTSTTFELVLSGVIDGSGDLTFESNANTAHFRTLGSADNTYDGRTIVNGSTLLLDKNNEVISVPDDLIVNAGNSGDSLVWTLAEQQMSDGGAVTLNDTSSYLAIFRVDAGHSESIRGLSGDGHLQIEGTRVVIENVADETFRGTIYGPGIITKQGTGMLTLSGDFADGGSGFPAGVEIHEGRVDANPTNTSFEFATWTVTGGILSGTNNIGPTTMDGGTFAPGNSPGCLNIAGDLQFNVSTTFDAEIGGDTQCSGFDHSAVNGTATLTGAELSLSHYDNFVSTIGATFQILSAASIEGVFNNLPDGATVTSGGQEYRIDYSETAVVLTKITDVVDFATTTTTPPPTSTSLQSTGTPAVAIIFTGVLLILLSAAIAVPRKQS